MTTNDAFVFKTITELMSTLDPMDYFTVNKSGIKMTCQNDSKKIAMSFKILSEMTSMFKCLHKTDMILINDSLNKFLGKVTKTDTLTLSDKSNDLVIHSENYRRQMTVTTATRKLNGQWTEHIFPDEYENCPGVLVNSRDFFIACKDIGAGNVNNIKLIGDFCLELSMYFECVVHSVSKLGHSDNNTTVTFNSDFHLNDFMKLQRIQTVSPRLRIYLRDGISMVLQKFMKTSLGTPASLRPFLMLAVSLGLGASLLKNLVEKFKIPSEPFQ